MAMMSKMFKMGLKVHSFGMLGKKKKKKNQTPPPNPAADPSLTAAADERTRLLGTTLGSSLIGGQ